MIDPIKKLNRIKEISIASNSSILAALKKMDAVDSKLLIVTENQKIKSIISIGDIQRSLIKNVDMKVKIDAVLRKKINVCSIHLEKQLIKEKMLEYRTEFMPLVNEEGEIVDIIFWNELFETNGYAKNKKLDIPIVLMAGGQGTRLRPLTNTIPKPLVPIGDKSIIEIIMNRFSEMGAKKFYVSVNYKAEMIREHLDGLANKNFEIEYFIEEKPLGTIGSIFLLKDKITTTFFVSNTDILVDQDYHEIYKYHKENGNEITIVAAVKNFLIPYGTLNLNKSGLLESLEEKPELTFMVNTGMYILEPHLLNEIPEGEFYHITDLIEKKIANNCKVGFFPVNDGAWMDIGNWNEYNKTQERFKNKYAK